MTREQKIICKQFLNDADKTHSCNEYKLLMQLLEHEPTTKNDLGVDAVNRKEFIDWLKNWTLGDATPLIDFVNSMPSVTPQEPTSEWEQDHEILKAYSDGATEVLDKIRAEIDELIEFNKRMNYMGIAGGLALAKNVIDKYKAESEVEE